VNPLPTPRTTKIVVGQRVVCRKTSRIGQVLGITNPREVCTIRYADSGEVETAPATELRLATWDELRDDKQYQGDNDTPTRVIRALPPEGPEPEAAQ
jgi:hypothetical protein